MNIDNQQDDKTTVALPPTDELKSETIQQIQFEALTTDKQKEGSFFAPILGLIIFVLPILVAFRLFDWRVVVSFLFSVISLPAFLLGLSGLYSIYAENLSLKWSDYGALTSIFILCSIPIYFLLVLPAYYFLSSLSFPIFVSFPLLITAVAFSIFLFMVTKPWGITEVAIVVGCSILHAMMILGGIILLKKLFP